MTNLTPEDINRVLAKWMGWTPDHYYAELHDTPCWRDPVTRAVVAEKHLPKYTESLDLCATIEAKLTDEQQIEYAKRLSVEVPKCMLIADCPPMRDQIAKEAFLVIHSTALQKATALVRALRSLGKGL